MDNTSTAMLAVICHAATPVKPSLNITNTGAVKGKMLKTTQIGLFGNMISKDMNQNGATAQSVNIDANPCPSRILELMAATPAESTANNK
jgi:hypothetical protein